MHAPGPGPYPRHAAPTVPVADVRTYARPGEVRAWLDEFERAGPPPDWAGATRTDWVGPTRTGTGAGRVAAVLLVLALIASLPVLAGWLASQRPRIVGAEVAAFAAEPAAATADTPAGQAQAPVAFDELLALLAANREAPGAPTAEAAPPAGEAQEAGAPASRASAGSGDEPQAAAGGGGDELAQVAAALVRIGRGDGSAADASQVCAVVSCSALGGSPDQTMVRQLFGAIDDGLVGPAEAASATGLSIAQAGRLLDAIATARGA
jgi:hypothetical protein